MHVAQPVKQVERTLSHTRTLPSCVTLPVYMYTWVHCQPCAHEFACHYHDTCTLKGVMLAGAGRDNNAFKFNVGLNFHFLDRRGRRGWAARTIGSAKAWAIGLASLLAAGRCSGCTALWGRQLGVWRGSASLAAPCSQREAACQTPHGVGVSL
jgi:hypothetical protein